MSLTAEQLVVKAIYPEFGSATDVVEFTVESIQDNGVIRLTTGETVMVKLGNKEFEQIKKKSFYIKCDTDGVFSPDEKFEVTRDMFRVRMSDPYENPTKPGEFIQSRWLVLVGEE